MHARIAGRRLLLLMMRIRIHLVAVGVSVGTVRVFRLVRLLEPV